MKQEKNNLSHHARMRRESGEILAERGNRLLLIEAWMVMTLSVPLWMAVRNACDALWVTVAAPVELSEAFYPVLLWIVGCALLLTVILPMLWGVLQLAGRIERGESPVLADVFASFADKASYRRGVWLSFGLLWRVLGTLGVTCLTYAALLRFAGGSLLWGSVGGVLIVLELTLGVALLLGCFPVAAVALLERDLSHSEIRARASRMRRAHPFAGFYFFFGFLPWFCLGILTVGILLLADVLPRMSVGYFRYCNFMTDSLIRMEEERYE